MRKPYSLTFTGLFLLQVFKYDASWRETVFNLELPHTTALDWCSFASKQGTKYLWRMRQINLLWSSHTTATNVPRTECHLKLRDIVATHWRHFPGGKCCGCVDPCHHQLAYRSRDCEKPQFKATSWALSNIFQPTIRVRILVQPHNIRRI